jgi:hypothetical protein
MLPRSLFSVLTAAAPCALVMALAVGAALAPFATPAQAGFWDRFEASTPTADQPPAKTQTSTPAQPPAKTRTAAQAQSQTQAQTQTQAQARAQAQAPAHAQAPARAQVPEHAQTPALPSWLAAHVGVGDGQIAAVVLARARALYYEKRRAGKIRNACYFAFDATRPDGLGSQGRFYIICEGARSFRVISSGHGYGLDVPGVADFRNGSECAKNFSNADGSGLTMGGDYVTAEEKTSFKGYYKKDGKYVPLLRTFLQYDGEGETADARLRQIGGHPSVVVRQQCRIKAPGNPHADKDGYVPVGDFIDYTGKRSNGCTNWSWADANAIDKMVQNNPTSLYIYPESADIVAVDRGVPGTYWNANCLRAIGKPQFWPGETLGPAIAQYRRENPLPPPKPLPICK